MTTINPRDSDYDSRKLVEIEHGRRVAEDPERRWGWLTPAGRIRAARRARLLLEGMRLLPGARVLETGCGTGVFTRGVARCAGDPALEVTAVDISPELLDIARTSDPPAARAEWILEDLLERRRPAAHYDAVYGSSILHHVPVAEFLAEFLRILKPGGRIAFCEPNILNPQIWMERKIRFIGKLTYTSETETAFTRFGMARSLIDAGFEDASVVPHEWLHPWIPRWMIPLIRNASPVAERIPGIREFAGSLLITARAPGPPAPDLKVRPGDWDPRGKLAPGPPSA